MDSRPPNTNSPVPRRRSTAVELDTGDLMLDLPREIGTTIGSYKVLSMIGTGGMANVFLAEHVQLGRRVALKKLHPQFTQHKDMVQRFFQEARTVNRISNDHIIQVTDFVETESGDVCYIMELLDGENLQEVLSHEGALPVNRVLDIAIQIAETMVEVHNTGVVHRDLKPANIFLLQTENKADFVKLLDFGVSKVIYAEQALGGVQETHAGLILGTPKYMAPEQANAQPTDARTDIYALGVILFELLCGSNPFAGDSTVQVLSNQLNLQPEPPSRASPRYGQIPMELDAVILRCLAKAPERRFQKMQDVADALRGVPTGANVLGTFEQGDTEPSGIRRAPERSPQPSLDMSDTSSNDAPDVSSVGDSEPAAAPSRSGLGMGLALTGLVALGVGGYFMWPRIAPDRLGEQVVQAPQSVALSAAEPTRGDAVEVAFTSTPPGAEVTLTGSTTPLGVTPFSKSFSRSNEPLAVELTLDGYNRATRQVSLTAGGRVGIELQKATASGVRAPARKAPKKPAIRHPGIGRSGTVNPFE